MRSRPSASQRESLAGNVPPKHLFRAIVHRIVPCILLFASILFLADCGGSSTGALPAGEWISISPQPASVPVNGTVTFTATTFEPDSTVTWSVLDDECGGVAGTLSSTTGNTVAYTAPATPPIYNPPCSGGKGNGQVTVEATYAGDLYNTVYFPITAPTVTVGLSPLTATVALGGTEQFVGYAVGNVNNGLTWQVNGVTGVGGHRHHHECRHSLLRWGPVHRAHGHAHDRRHRHHHHDLAGRPDQNHDCHRHTAIANRRRVPVVCDQPPDAGTVEPNPHGSQAHSDGNSCREHQNGGL